MSTIVWWFEHSLVVPFLGIGMGIDLFQSCGHCWIFHIFWHIECSTWIVSSFRILNSSAGIPLPLLALLTAVLPKAHLPSHSGMFGLGWVTTPWWLCESLCSFFVQVFLCILSICSRSLLLLWSLYQFCSLLCSSLDEMFLWYFQFSEEKSSLFPSVVFPLFICIVHCILYKAIRIFLRCQSDHLILLFETIQWLPISFREKAQFSPLSARLYDMVPVSLLTLSPHLCFPPSKLASLLFLELIWLNWLFHLPRKLSPHVFLWLFP